MQASRIAGGARPGPEDASSSNNSTATLYYP